MNDILYLEPDDEITVVIDRLKASPQTGVVLVIPRGSSLVQSIVNLKILKRNAEEKGKEIFLVTNDRITGNIASQVGISVFAKVTEAERAKPALAVKPREESEIEGPERVPEEERPSGDFHVNNYARAKKAEMEEEPENEISDKEGEEEKVSAESPLRDVSERQNLDASEPRFEAPLPVMTENENNNEQDEYDGPKEHFQIKRIHGVEAEEPVSNQPEYQSHSKKQLFDRSPIKSGMTTGRSMEKKPKKRLQVVATVLIFLIIGGLAFSYTYFPAAEASLKLKTSDLNRDIEVNIDRNAKVVNATNLTIPGTLIEIDKETTKQYPATGKKDLGDKAHGKMTIYNSFDTSSHKYPAGTKFAANSKVFMADSEFTVAAAVLSLNGGNITVTPGEGTVNVTAEQSGDSYNLTSTDYVVSGVPSKITAKGGDMAGGTTRVVNIVTDKDLSDAEASLKTEITTLATKELTDKTTAQGSKLLDGGVTSEMLSESHDKEVGDQVDNFNYTIKLKAYGLGFLEKDLRDALAISVASDLTKNGQMLVNPEKSDLNYSVTESDQDMMKAKIKVAFKAKIASKIEESTVKNLVRNKSLAAATSALEQQANVADVKVTVTPGFLPRTPILVNKISVKFDYADAN